MKKLPQEYSIQYHFGNVERKLIVGQAAIIGDKEIIECYMQYERVARQNEYLKEAIKSLTDYIVHGDKLLTLHKDIIPK